MNSQSAMVPLLVVLLTSYGGLYIERDSRGSLREPTP